MVFSIIKKSQLEGSTRLDAEYYQPEYLQFVRNLRKSRVIRLCEIAYITDGEHGSPIWDENSGIKYYSAQHVRDGVIDSSNVNTISKIIDEKNKRSSLREGDVLLSTVGTIGFAGLVTKGLLPANIDRHVARIVLKKDTLDPEFLVAFLNSSYGKFQSIRESTGNVQLNLFIDKIKEIRVPSINNSQISQLVKTVLDQLDNSENFYKEAENLLLEELGLKDFKFTEDLSYIVNYSDTDRADRIDADFFQPKYEKIIRAIRTPIRKLGELTSFLNHAKQPPYFENGEIPIVTQKHLGQAFLDPDLLTDPETKFTSNDWLEQYKTYKLRKGDVLYYSVGAYIGKTNVVLDDLAATSASFLTIIRLKEELDPIYLSVVLNSIIGISQSEKWQSATAQQYIYPKDIRNFRIPVLPIPTQQKIADLVKKSHEARKKSKDLLEEAKRSVEEMIEKGGE